MVISKLSFKEKQIILWFSLELSPDCVELLLVLALLCDDLQSHRRTRCPVRGPVKFKKSFQGFRQGSTATNLLEHSPERALPDELQILEALHFRFYPRFYLLRLQFHRFRRSRHSREFKQGPPLSPPTSPRPSPPSWRSRWTPSVCKQRVPRKWDTNETWFY